MPRRTDHQGSIRQRSKHLWEGSVQLNGRRYYVSGRTKTEVSGKIDGLRAKRNTGRLVAPSKVTTRQHLDDWLRAVTPDLRPKTIADYDATIRNHLGPAFGQIPLQRLSTADIALQFADWRLEGRWSGKTLQNIHRAFHRALVFAVHWGRISHNPMDGLPAPKSERKAPTVWSLAEANRFLARLPMGTWQGALFAILLATGCRIGEALALTWDEWDGDNLAVRIRRSRTRLNRTFVEGPVKTAAGVREVRTPAFVGEFLGAWRETQHAERLNAGALWCGEGRTITLQDGTTPLHRRAYNALQKLCAAAGVPKMRPHDLRHFHASLLLADGIGVPAVARRLGHASPAVTMAIYAHSLKEADERTAQVVELRLCPSRA